MPSKAQTAAEYLKELPEDRRKVIKKIRAVINKHLPKGFKERMSYGMLGWVVPHSIYPDGYHCTPELPLPFLNLASQKNYVALYHMGLYADKKTYDWFVKEYAARVPSKLDMGKSCIRFKKLDDIPYDLIAELMEKFTVDDWIALYESAIKR